MHGYKIKGFTIKVILGFHIMAWYYISWMLTMHDDISMLNLPFDNEYKISLNRSKDYTKWKPIF